MIDERIIFLITSEITNELSDDDSDVLKDWLQESAENINYYHSYKEAFINGKYQIKAQNSEKVYKSLSNKLQFSDVSNPLSNNLKSGSEDSAKKFFGSWIGFAAIFLTMMTFLWIIYQQIKDKQILNDHSLANELVVKNNPSGIKSFVILPDGSKVKLNSESYIEYFQDFRNGRTVKLVGEAFFDIVRDTLQPFVVETGDLNINVLGTSFNVEAFPFEENVKVALVTGKVEIQKREGFNIATLNYLDPKEMIVFNHQSSEYEIKTFDYNSTLGWKDGNLVFQEERFDEVIKKLERWYGVEIKVGPVADMSGKYTGIYKNTSLEFVMEGMGFTSDFDFKIEGNIIYIN